MLFRSGCSSAQAETRTVLAALAPKVVGCKEALSAQYMGNALYGLQGCSDANAETRTVLAALAPKVVGCKEALFAQAVGNALYGLQGCSSAHAETRAALASLLPLVQSFLGSLQAVDAVTPHIAHGVYALLAGAALAPSDPARGWLLAAAEAVATKLALLSPEPSRSVSERKAAASIVAAAESWPGATAVTNEFLHSFEADIVLRLPAPGPGGVGGGCVVINVEVDGPSHQSAVSRRFCAVRDAHLASKGVVVARWDLVARQKAGQAGTSSLVEWLEGIVESSR